MSSEATGQSLKIVRQGESTELFLGGLKLAYVLDYHLTMKPRDCELTVVLDIKGDVCFEMVADEAGGGDAQWTMQ